ncbi:hypothetical protein K470DRAFT_175992 [Piedraia hortae CBS 480.64]|uniref:Uncharacterized protein n=1 Tax=Piedraia hortae CBS 480.64 TaxID=1314780 RepID=A0A6A7C527_9PEZI|nr:hypothetical protein K470DRAFT_175992 [Piedraia hortae CBS 480.64]
MGGYVCLEVRMRFVNVFDQIWIPTLVLLILIAAQTLVPCFSGEVRFILEICEKGSGDADIYHVRIQLRAWSGTKKPGHKQRGFRTMGGTTLRTGSSGLR